jgi:molecular chaperone HscB
MTNYFQLFELPEQLVTDKGLLKRKYLLLSATHHPDKNNNSPESVKVTAHINEGYKALSTAYGCLKHVLLLNQIITETEKYALPPDFLMEMMELGEQQMEGADINEAILKAEGEAFEPVKHLYEQNTITAFTANDWNLLKAYYFKKKYFDRLQGLGEKM